MQNLAPEDAAFVLGIENEWTEKGKAEVLAEGQVRIVTRQLQRRFGTVPAGLIDALRGISVDQIDGFADVLLDFKSISEAEAWIAAAS